MSEPSAEPFKSSSQLVVNRRRFLATVAVAAGAAALAPVRTGHATSPEQGLLPSPTELLQRQPALELCRSLHNAGRLTNEASIGWIDVTPVASHEAYKDSVDSERSKSYVAGVSPTEAQSNTHGTWALQFATQEGGGGQAGLSQKEWSRIIVTNLFAAEQYAGINPERDAANYAVAVRYLVQQGVGVIGTIPTWRDSDFSNIPPETKKTLIATITSAYQFASDKNVIIVLPAGNADSDLSTAKDARVLHEIARAFKNVITVGGVDQQFARARWDNGGAQQGSNYGEGYIDFVSSATNRIVPWGTENKFAKLDGTTFCVGDVVSLIAIVQNVFKTKTGLLPSPIFAIRIITETTKDLKNRALFGAGLIQEYNVISAAEKYVAHRVASG